MTPFARTLISFLSAGKRIRPGVSYELIPVIPDKRENRTSEYLLFAEGKSKNKKVQRSTAEPDLHVAIGNDVDLMHTENLNLIPHVPEKTIFCYVIAEPILSDVQVKTGILKRIEKKTRGKKYGEKVVALSIEGHQDPKTFTESFMEGLEAIRMRVEGQNKGYKVEFVVACPQQELVEKIQNVGMKALAFSKEGDGDIVQVEGIILALRALKTGKADNLFHVYKLLTGREMAKNTKDMDELARQILFILPAKKVDLNYVSEINKLIEKNIMSAL
jgi:hypothetical protein